MCKWYPDIFRIGNQQQEISQGLQRLTWQNNLLLAYKIKGWEGLSPVESQALLLPGDYYLHSGSRGRPLLWSLVGVERGFSGWNYHTWNAKTEHTRDHFHMKYWGPLLFSPPTPSQGSNQHRQTVRRVSAAQVRLSKDDDAVSVGKNCGAVEPGSLLYKGTNPGFYQGFVS